MRSGQIRESCGCNNAGCRSFSFCGRPKAEYALRHFGKKGNARCAHFNSLRSLLSVFPCGSPMLSGKKGNAPSVLRLVSLPAVRFSVRIAGGSPGKKATHLRCSDSFHSLLSHFPCRSLRSLGKSATLAALTPTASPAG